MVLVVDIERRGEPRRLIHRFEEKEDPKAPSNVGTNAPNLRR